MQSSGPSCYLDSISGIGILVAHRFNCKGKWTIFKQPVYV